MGSADYTHAAVRKCEPTLNRAATGRDGYDATVAFELWLPNELDSRNEEMC